jgi:hypothetical protein
MDRQSVIAPVAAGRASVHAKSRELKFYDGGEYLVDVLAGLGVDMVNSIPGAQTLSIWDAIGRRWC